MNAALSGLEKLLAALDKLEIRYAVGGSVASSIRGNYRYTNDIDIVIELHQERIGEFVHEIGPEFYADPESIREAFSLLRPCNIIHIPSAFKFDFFPSIGAPFAEAQIHRSTFEQTTFFGAPLEFSVISPEDILLAKLHWFHLGGETSEQQWKDVTALIAIQGPNLDRQYIQSWSEELQITHLLNRLSLLP